ncbi:sensor histidine kinase [Acidicapsa ligni]|uniref:sensor histidine kinase n=1 Tax=Acidicapsa ligni TaxID=542300 RepID=UPI0021DF892F|nr:hypothetical protein [Acidicapsa ligni]
MIFVFFWPRQMTLSAFGVQSLRILLSVIASFVLYPLCRYAWRKKEHFAPLALSAIACAAVLAFIGELLAQRVTHAMLGVPPTVLLHSVLTASLRYQFVLEAWCSCYFALKLLDRIDQQADLMRQARIKQRDGLIASYRYQLPGRLLSDMLHGISRSITKEESLRASLMIARFGELLRNMLEYPERHFAGLYQETEEAREYLNLQRDLLGRKLQLEFEVDCDLDNLLMPRWLLVPLIEELSTAMEHTDIPTPQASISISLSGQRLKLDLILDRPIASLRFVGTEPTFEATRSLLETLYDTGHLFELNRDAVTLLRIELPPWIEPSASSN